MLGDFCPPFCVPSQVVASDVLMGDTSRTLGNAMDTATAEMGAMRPLRHVETTVGEKTSDVPMGNASRPDTNATDTATAEIGAMRPLRHVETTVGE